MVRSVKAQTDTQRKIVIIKRAGIIIQLYNISQQEISNHSGKKEGMYK
jgi:hypothetical protein